MTLQICLLCTKQIILGPGLIVQKIMSNILRQARKELLYYKEKNYNYFLIKHNET